MALVRVVTSRFIKTGARRYESVPPGTTTLGQGGTTGGGGGGMASYWAPAGGGGVVTARSPAERALDALPPIDDPATPLQVVDARKDVLLLAGRVADGPCFGSTDDIESLVFLFGFD